MIKWRLRLRTLSGVDEGLSSALAEALARSEAMALVDEARAAPYDPLLVVFAADPAPAFEFLRAHAGLSRVILAAPGLASCDDELALRLMAAGAGELLDIAAHELDDSLRALHQRLERWWGVDEALSSERVQARLCGHSLPWQRALRELIHAAKYGSQPVLLRGETGTGKEAAARLIHDLDPSAAGEFVIVDCASIVESLSGSELFGHKRGAFTGADRDREGAVARANGGTLFLDEVGELNPNLQAELLRVLQEGTFKPVGDDHARKSRFRLVAATHRDLLAMVREGSFRSDLYYRIAAATCRLPPLRERRGDVSLLVAQFCRELGMRIESPRAEPELDPRLTRLLERLPWPGNVRQLRSVVQAIVSNHADGPLRLAHLPADVYAELGGPPSSRRGWNARLASSVRTAIEGGATLEELVENTKTLACEVALNLEGSARKAAQRIGVSTRMVEKRRSGAGGRAGRMP